MLSVTVREHARLTVDGSQSPTLDRACISSSAFDWLCKLSAGFSSAGARLVEVEDRRWLRLDNYVGVIQTPCGTRLEILPKSTRDGESAMTARALLRRMICSAMDLPAREAGEAHLELFDGSVSEWVMERFLSSMQILLRRGLRFDYLRCDKEEPFLRGQLDVAQQMRQPPHRQHLFRTRYDVFSADRPENRLLSLAVDRVAAITRSPRNWRLGNELRHLLRDVPRSTDIREDFRRWQGDRLMAHYRFVRPWCELVLHRHVPLTGEGNWQGISMLFPMERLFERYVADWLRRMLAPGAVLTAQASRHHLCVHEGEGLFQLRPDLLITFGERQWVLDTKWKMLRGDRSSQFGLSQADLYQMLAYGLKYLNGKGDLYLVYPWAADVEWPLQPFWLGEALPLHVVPFDLDRPGISSERTAALPLAPAPSDCLS
jgi:5-methylcytosine-specific restriction enzyme subunit McrC